VGDEIADLQPGQGTGAGRPQLSHDETAGFIVGPDRMADLV
jgi:hypothetical protein